MRRVLTHRARALALRLVPGPRRLGRPGPPADSFGAMLAEVSRDLGGVPDARIDAQIEQSLARFVEFLGVDRGSVFRLSPDGHAAHKTHTYALPGDRAAAFPVVAPDSEFPWLVEQIRHGRPARLGSLSDDLPPEAAMERQSALRAGFRSYILVPFVVPGVGPGALGFGSRRPRAWPDGASERLTMLGDIVASALRRRQNAHALRESESFERLVRDLVKQLVSAPAEDLDGRIRAGLERVVAHFGVERSGLARFAKDGPVLTAHTAGRVGASDALSRSDFAWYVGEVRDGRTIRIDQPGDVPAHAASMREFLRSSGMRSLLAIPLREDGRVWGRISLSVCQHSRRWTDGEVRRLKLVGEIMKGALLRQEAGREARRHQEDVAFLARVGTLGQLAAALAHDLNEPLAAIKLNAQTMRRLLAAGRWPDALDETCSDIIEDATRAGDLIHRLRELLRRREGERRALAVNQVIAEVQELLQIEARHYGVGLRLVLAPDVPMVSGNAAQLQQVLLSLVRNAAEAMLDNGPDHEDIMVRTSVPSTGEAMISIEDRGRAPQGSLEELFAPFHSTKPEGIGVSLAVNRSIVETHGGRLWAERRPDGGLAVHLTLPGLRGDRP